MKVGRTSISPLRLISTLCPGLLYRKHSLNLRATASCTTRTPVPVVTDRHPGWCYHVLCQASSLTCSLAHFALSIIVGGSEHRMRLIGSCGREIDLHLVIHNIPRLWHQPVVGLREGIIAKARRSKGVADDLRRPVDPLHCSAYVIGSQRCQGTAKRVACAVDLEQQAKLSYLFLMWKPYVASSVLAECSSGEAGSMLSNSSTVCARLCDV